MDDLSQICQYAQETTGLRATAPYRWNYLQNSATVEKKSVLELEKFFLNDELFYQAAPDLISPCAHVAKALCSCYAIPFAKWGFEIYNVVIKTLFVLDKLPTLKVGALYVYM